MPEILIIIFILLIYYIFWFVISLIQKRNDVADIAWGLGFILVSWSSFYLFGFSKVSLIVNLLVTVWGLRLSWHIYSRHKGKPEDERYLEMRTNWHNFYLRSFMQVFLLQGLMLFIISTPVIFINRLILQQINFFVILGFTVWVFGFCFEAVSDQQLKNFLTKPKNKGQLMQEGLWKYSRHPNYFGEVLLWWGIWIITLNHSLGFLTVIGPITITILILFVSGIPLIEKKYKGRKDFEEYKERTSLFFPLPPRK